MLNTDPQRFHPSETRAGEQGFLLLGMVVAIFLILLVLAVAAPRAAHELRREREVETVHRGNAYVRAIEVYYLKMGHYPTSIEQLEKTNNMRFLRKRYPDPMTGKDDWRVINLGEAKTTVKGFFGKPLGGIESTGLGGSSAGSGSMTSSFGSSGSSGSAGSTSGLGSSSGSGSGGLTSSFGSGSSATGSSGLSSSTSGNSSGSNGTGGDSGIGSSATAGPIVGVGLTKTGNSIMALNGQTTYDTWEFLYDPRIEQLKAKVNLFGGGMTSTDAAHLGAASDSKSSSSGSLGFGSGSNSGSQSTGGSSGSGSFGSGSFGSGGFGSGTSSSPNPSPTTNTPQ